MSKPGRLTLPLAMLVVFVFAMITIKMAHPFFCAQDDLVWQNNIKYSSLNFSEKLGLGFCARIDDMSFINLLAATVATFLVWSAVRKIESKSPQSSQLLEWDWKAYAVWAGISSLFTVVYLIGISAESNKPTAGTFYCDNLNMTVKHSQVVEGVFNIYIILLSSIAFVYGLRIWRSRHTLDQIMGSDFKEVWENILNVGVFPTTLCVAYMFAVYGGMQKIATMKGTSLISLPSSWPQMIVYIFMCYLPYWILTALFFVWRPSNYKLSYQITLQLAWLTVA